MKTIKQTQQLLYFGILALVFYSCTKEGPVGPKGDTGSAGQNGQNGNSVVTAYNFTVTASSWTYNSPSYYTNLSTPAITYTNNDSVSVMVYFNTGGFNWYALPYDQYNGSAPNYLMEFYTKPNYTQITWIYNTPTSQGNDPNTVYGVTTMKYKVVVIPPSQRRANPNVHLNNYAEVKAVFNLKD